MRISIVIPTRDRPAALRRCLAALGGEHEIVIVDDGSRDRAAVARALERSPGARLVRGSGQGPATARNLGVGAAGGDVVCFLDDDCEPQPGWAEALARPATEFGAAAGMTVAPPGAAPTVRASQAIVEHLTVTSLDPAGRLGFAPSCNLAVARRELTRLPFDQTFPTPAGEDRDWSDRAVAAGVAPLFVPDALVVHRQRLGPAGFVRQQYAYGRGAARYRAAAGVRELSSPGFYAGLVRRGFERGAAAGVLVLAAQGVTAAGVAAERLTRLRA
jgi:glycosyltransferase involved in cell wall biosynthesis